MLAGGSGGGAWSQNVDCDIFPLQYLSYIYLGSSVCRPVVLSSCHPVILSSCLSSLRLRNAQLFFIRRNYQREAAIDGGDRGHFLMYVPLPSLCLDSGDFSSNSAFSRI